MSHIPTFAFPAIAGTDLPTAEGWKAELAWVSGYVMRQFTCPKAVTHPTTNRAQCSATTLIMYVYNCVTATLNRHTVYVHWDDYRNTSSFPGG